MAFLLLLLLLLLRNMRAPRHVSHVRLNPQRVRKESPYLKPLVTCPLDIDHQCLTSGCRRLAPTPTKDFKPPTNTRAANTTIAANKSLAGG
ncbi:hypothetical protein CMEL01_10538 [Colletotrichum melonis]|uniref:Secreted protein n=1 Tax=Colletotrichum melonis TaxID=1209925 RepID=A0AAI9TX74_9PEZI|nr:hypothetical protein CMEL01_10538 [Colletotrichum melonis]